MIDDALADFVNEWRLGDVATMGPEGPNVSPKGTFQTLDAGRIAFAEIRSPRTKVNLAHDARLEVSMVDVFARKGARFRGRGAWHGPDTAVFAGLRPRWEAVFGARLAGRFRGFVVIELAAVRPLSTPAYDIGAREAELRREYLARFTAVQEAALDD